jgi:transposase-like protein
MEHVPRHQETKEFREQAVQLVLEQQVPIPEATRHLSSISGIMGYDEATLNQPQADEDVFPR